MNARTIDAHEYELLLAESQEDGATMIACDSLAVLIDCYHRVHRIGRYAPADEVNEWADLDPSEMPRW